MKQPTPYEKPIKNFLILLSLLIVSPLVLSIGFRSQQVYNEGIGIYISYFLIILGISLALFTIYFGFKAFQSLLNVLFRE